MNVSETYIELAESLSELIDLESKIYNRKRLFDKLKQDLLTRDDKGSCGKEFSASGFRIISEGLEKKALESHIVYNDVFKEGDPTASLLNPSNLKSFVITLMADAHKKGNFKEKPSKNDKNGVEFKYTIEMKKWKGEKNLRFEVIVENGFIKTGFFNWY